MIGEARRWVVAMVAAAGVAGCAPVLIGAGVAGGYAISKDSVRNTFSYPRSHVYAVSREIVRDEGLIIEDHEAQGTLKAEVEGTRVTVTVRQVSETSVELKVKARNKFMMPMIEVAQAIYNRISGKL